jgi:hypothetical protein
LAEKLIPFLFVKIENAAQKENVTALPPPKDKQDGCDKCRSCLSCKEKQTKEAEEKASKAEFDLNITALNRVMFACMTLAMLISNIVLWLFLSL